MMQRVAKCHMTLCLIIDLCPRVCVKHFEGTCVIGQVIIISLIYIKSNFIILLWSIVNNFGLSKLIKTLNYRPRREGDKVSRLVREVTEE